MIKSHGESRGGKCPCARKERKNQKSNFGKNRKRNIKKDQKPPRD